MHKEENNICHNKYIIKYKNTSNNRGGITWTFSVVHYDVCV